MSVSLTLQEKLKQKHKEQQESMENLTQEQLSTLRKELRDIFQVELNTIKTDMRLQLQDLALEVEQTKNQTLWKLTKGRVLYPALSALTVLLTICLAGSGYLHWQISQLTDNQQQIAMQQQTLQNMEKRTFGINLQEDQNGKFVVVSPGISLQSGWTAGKNQAYRITR